MILRGINALTRRSSLVGGLLATLLLAAMLASGNLQTEMRAASKANRQCRGVKITGGRGSLERAVNKRGPGTTFCISKGKYAVSRRGLKLQDGDVLDGVGRAHPGTRGKRPRVRIVGQGTTVIYGGDRVRLLDLSITDARRNTGCSSSGACGQAVKPGSRWRILRVRIHHADAQCIGSAGHSLLISDSELDHCGDRFDGNGQNGFASAIKAGVKGAFTIRKSYVHNNNQGVWCDVDCSSERMAFVVTSNRIVDNYSFGVHFEHTTKNSSTPARALIKGNVVKGNNWGRLPTKADIGIMSAENARVVENKVGATRAHPRKGRGIIFRSTKGRGAATGMTWRNRLGGDSLAGCALPGVICK